MTDEPLFGPGAEPTLRRAREEGSITYSEINTILPPGEITSHHVELIFEYLRDIGIDVIED